MLVLVLVLSVVVVELGVVPLSNWLPTSVTVFVSFIANCVPLPYCVVSIGGNTTLPVLLTIAPVLVS